MKINCGKGDLSLGVEPILGNQRACSMSLFICCAKWSSITFSVGGTNEWLVAWLTGYF